MFLKEERDSLKIMFLTGRVPEFQLVINVLLIVPLFQTTTESGSRGDGCVFLCNYLLLPINNSEKFRTFFEVQTLWNLIIKLIRMLESDRVVNESN